MRDRPPSARLARADPRRAGLPEIPAELLEALDENYDASVASLPSDAFSAPPANTSQQLLNEVTQLHVEQRLLLDRMCAAQRAAIAAPTAEALAALEAEQRALKARLDSELRALDALRTQAALDSPDLQRAAYLEAELGVQARQLELFYHELQWLGQPAVRCFAALVIVAQPFAQVLPKGRVLRPEQLVVRLLTGAATQLTRLGPVQASVAWDAASAKSARLVEGDVQLMDAATRTARFPLRFVNGSRRAPIQLRFGMQIEISGPSGPVACQVESAPSNAYVVTTHDSQWEGCEGALLRREVFGNAAQREAPWMHFCNALQRRFLVATRQELLRPVRPLSAYDLHYLGAKFFGGRPAVAPRLFDDFWAWFGKCMQQLRFARHIAALWRHGLLYGFWSREDVEAQIRGQEPGTFLVRFSERNAGLFGVAYVAADGATKHYLITEADTLGARKTLPEFLMSCPQFAHVLQLSALPDGRFVFNKCAKVTALEALCAHNTVPPRPSPGYQPLQ